LALRVENIALIDHAELEFLPGLSVITGETGAGKSLLVDALQLCLGARADASLIRTGAERGGAEALFSLHDAPAAAKWLDDNGYEDSGEVFLSRELQQNGRNVCRINGIMVTLSNLRELAEALVDMHGQHEHQSLLHEKNHLGYLDSFIGDIMTPALAAFGKTLEQTRAMRRKLESLHGPADERERRRDYLEFVLKEINAAELQAGETEKLEARRALLRHAESIKVALFTAHQQLYDGLGDRRPSALSQVSVSLKAMEGIAEYAESYKAMAEGLNDIYYNLEDICLQLGEAKGGLDEEPGELDRVETRLAAIGGITKKYGGSEENALEMAQKCQKELEELADSEERVAALNARIAEHEEELCKQAQRLHKLREKGAVKLQAAVLEQLKELGFSGASFYIEVSMPQDREELLAAMTAQGCERVAFYLSANAGEAAKPLARVASGGEVARIMLALKTITGGGISTLVFDEIDTGVSGRMAQTVAAKLARLARGKQVFCVSHLPQMAAMADQHFFVYKQEDAGRTATYIVPLDMEGRTHQLAAMSAGQAVTEAALAHAAAMLAEAREVKNA